MPKLLNSTDELKGAFAALDANFSWNNIKASVEDVEADYIESAIGAIALTSITAAHTLTPAEVKVKRQLIKACAHLAVYDWSQTSPYRFNDQSLSVGRDKDGAIISDKKLRDLRAFCHAKGFGYLDEAILIMEGALADFPDYADSKERIDSRKTFLTTAIELNRFVRTAFSRQTFLSYQPVMQDVQDDFLPRYMTPAYYELFKERYLDGDLSPDEAKLLPIVAKAVAHLTMARVYQDPTLATDDGVLQKRMGNSVDYEQNDPGGMHQLALLADHQEHLGSVALTSLKLYLQRNASSYPEYVIPVISPIEVNSRESGLFIL